MVILLAHTGEAFRSAARPEGVGELGDSKDAFGVELLSFLLRHARQQAEVVFLNRFLPALGLKLALGTMPIQNDVGWRRAG